MSLRPGIDLIQIRFGLASARLGFAWDQRWTKRVPEEHHSGAKMVLEHHVGSSPALRN